MRTDVAQRYAFEPEDLRTVMTDAGIRDPNLRQAIMDTALQAAKAIEDEPRLVKEGWRYVDLSLTELAIEDDRVRVRLHARAWPDRPAAFLQEELVWRETNR